MSAAISVSYTHLHNILEVTAVSAIALTAPSREKLLAKLQKMTGKNIVLTETVDPAVLGGLRLDMDGTRLDGTVQRHLERLRTEIDGAVLYCLFYTSRCV